MLFGPYNYWYKCIKLYNYFPVYCLRSSQLSVLITRHSDFQNIINNLIRDKFPITLCSYIFCNTLYLIYIPIINIQRWNWVLSSKICIKIELHWTFKYWSTGQSTWKKKEMKPWILYKYILIWSCMFILFWPAWSRGQSYTCLYTYTFDDLYYTYLYMYVSV